MSKFIDSTGMAAILAAIINKFALKSDTTKTWIGTKDQYNDISNKENNTIYFVKKQ